MFDAAEDGRKKSLDRLDGWQTRGLAYPAQIIGFPITHFVETGMAETLAKEWEKVKDQIRQDWEKQ